MRRGLASLNDIRMVTDIFSRAERKVGDEWEAIPGLHPFSAWPSYRLFGFLANVRNYSAVEPISRPRGLPPGIELPSSGFDGPDEDWLGEDDHSWLLLSELQAIDFDRIVEDRRTTGIVNGLRRGNLTAPVGEGVKMTLREFLGVEFFEELDRLEKAGAERIVFGFGT